MSHDPSADHADVPPAGTDGLRLEGYDLALVLSGGNALGAYQAGAYQALQERGLEPDWVAGASAGSINGALICGNQAEQRISALRDLWVPAGDGTGSAWSAGAFEEARRTAAASWTFGIGKPELFVPRALFGPWWNPFGNPEPSSLYDTTPLRATLEQLVDFDLLNRGTPRFCATAVDIETGEDVVFDTRRGRIGADHLRASSALLPAFPPVEVEGRLLGDAGISANLPLDAVLEEAGARPLLCIAVDLLPLKGPRPQTLGETVNRMQDLLFATQSRRSIAAWQAIFDERVRRGGARSVTLLHIAYSDHAREVSGKAFDFSARSAGARWRGGQTDLGVALDQLLNGAAPLGEPGLSVYGLAADRGTLEPVRWALGPVKA